MAATSPHAVSPVDGSRNKVGVGRRRLPLRRRLLYRGLLLCGLLALLLLCEGVFALLGWGEASEQDDPYSDWWMLRIEEKLEQTRSRLQLLRQQVDEALARVPAALSLGENLNLQPVKLPLFINAQLGFMAVYLLAEYDEVVRKLILAHHTALIDRHTLDIWLEEGAHLLRSLFTAAQQYQYSGTVRDDFAAQNAAARAALEKYGPLPQDVLEGSRRSRFAPEARSAC